MSFSLCMFPVCGTRDESALIDRMTTATAPFFAASIGPWKRAPTAAP